MLLVQCQITFAQNHDHLWLFGYDSNPTFFQWGGTVMDFNASPPSISYLYNPMNFLQTNASVCDSTGNLQFYTNGLSISNMDHQTMLNGTGLNPGEFATSMGGWGYILDQGALIVPHPNATNSYFLIHSDRVASTLELDGHSKHLYYSIIDMNMNGGLGEVVEKNVLLLNDTLDLGKLTAVKHANGRDWWVVVSEYAKNSFYRLKVSPEGIENLGTIEVGEALPDISIGQAVFTPDGTKYVRNSLVGQFFDTDYLDIYDFDRCTGELSNQVRVPYVHGALGGGVAVSPSSQFAYLSHESAVYQYDLWADDIAASKRTVASYDGFTENNLATTFYLAQLAPDGKIYINCSNSVHYLHVIHQPNKFLHGSRVEQHGIHLPTFNSFSLPNFPNYRLGPLDGSPCDTLGLDNHPVAKFRCEQDGDDYLTVEFTDLSTYEPATWSWSFGDGAVSQDTSPVHSFEMGGSYEVCLTVSNQYSSDTFCKTLQLGPSASGDIEAPQAEVSLFPNPAREATNVRIGGLAPLGDYLPRQAVLVLHAATGQPVLTQRLTAGWGVVELEGLPPGIYFWEVSDGERLLGSGKLVVGSGQ